ncbi:MAG: chloride channel protein, partial [Planctomycetota bacterium]
MKNTVRSAVSRTLTYLGESHTLGPVLLAVTVGLVGGVGAILFRWLIRGAHYYFFEQGAHALPFLGGAYVIFLPAVGLLIVGYMVRRWAPEAEGHGVPEVMLAVKKHGGRIRPRVAGIKALASAVCIGSGGSVGREGPIVQIGCTFGSTVGQILGLNEQRVRLLVACGAAAGVAGTFNAPIAGVLFALEVILANFTARAFGLVVIASVTATALCQSVLGTEHAFALAEMFKLASPWEFPMYLVFGVLAGVIALAYTRSVYLFEDLFERWLKSPVLRNILGGLTIGALGYFGSPYLFGVGYGFAGDSPFNGIENALSGNIALGMLALLVLLKIVATSTTLASGGSGGVFAPSLFIGAMAGGAFGIAMNKLFPGIPAPAGAYAIVGMAAVFAGAAHAPITAIVILFEMTGDYRIILPLMLAAVMSYLVASRISADSIYTIKVRRRGGMAPQKSELSVLDFILVADAMNTDVDTILADVPLADVAKRFHGGHERALIVVDADGNLAGLVTLYDVEAALVSGGTEPRTAGDIMTRSLITCTRDQTLREVVPFFTSKDIGRIPVVDENDPKKLVGMLRRREMLWAYGVIAAEHQNLLDRTGM